MPSKSDKQARLMAACAHGADYEICPPKKVAKDFNKADKNTGRLKKAMESLTFKQFLLNERVHYACPKCKKPTSQDENGNCKICGTHVEDEEQSLNEGLFTDIRKLIYTTPNERKQQFLLKNLEDIQGLLQDAQTMSGYFKADIRANVAARLRSIKQALIHAEHDNPVYAAQAVDAITQLRSYLARAVANPKTQLKKPKIQGVM